MRDRGKLVAALLLLSSLTWAGCDWPPTECVEACQKMKTCEQLHIPVDECADNCGRQTLDCSEQIDCVLRSKCDSLAGCTRHYPCQVPSWDDDDDEW